MKTTHRFERSFGPAASFAGIVILIAGIIATYFMLTGLALVILGAFVGFTDTSTSLDPANRKVRYTNNLFGFIRVGKWITVDKTMNVGVRRDNRVYRTYSRSNQVIDVKAPDTKLFLLNEYGKPILPLMKFRDGDDFQQEILKISSAFEVGVIH